MRSSSRPKSTYWGRLPGLTANQISQSINEFSFSKQEKRKHISRLGIGTVTVTVLCAVNKKKHWKFWLKHNTYNFISITKYKLLLSRPDWTEYNQLQCNFQWLQVFYTKMYFNYTLYIPIVFQLQNTNYFCQGHKIQNTKYFKCIYNTCISISCISITPTLMVTISTYSHCLETIVTIFTVSNSLKTIVTIIIYVFSLSSDNYNHIYVF